MDLYAEKEIICIPCQHVYSFVLYLMVSYEHHKWYAILSLVYWVFWYILVILAHII